MFQVKITLIIPHFDNKEDQDGSEASVFVLSSLSLYPVISIDHNFAVKPSPFDPDLVSLQNTKTLPLGDHEGASW